MNQEKTIQPDDMRKMTIQIFEPFAEFLKEEPDEYRFEISLLDVVRFAGHACPSMVGAFLISQRAVKELFPKDGVCVRGEVAIEIPTSVTQGATGPISNVFSMIFGAWDQSGFGGLQGQFVRRGLLKYDSANIPAGTFRFHNLKTKKFVDISYDPAKAPSPSSAAEMPFQKIWRQKITAITRDPEIYVTSRRGE